MFAKKHILVITTSFPGGEPGSEAAGSFVSDFVQELSEHIKVTVIVPSSRWMADEERGNLNIRRFVVPCLPLSLLSPFNPLHWLDLAKVMLSGQRRVTETVMASNIDHIVALWALPSGYWAREASKKFDIPYTIWALGSDIWSLGGIPLVKGMLSKVLRESRFCFADGCLLKEDVESISGRQCEFLASARKLPVVGKKQLSRTPPYRLAFLGRWHPNKGIDLLWESLELLNDDDWSKIAEIRIYGGGVMEKGLRLACDNLQKMGRPVTVGGFLDKKEATKLLFWADYLLIPSRIESIPVVFSDAMQAGCPVIAMPVGDLSVLLDNYSAGILAEELSPSAFAKALQHALKTSPSLYSPGIEACREKFNIHNTVEHLLGAISLSNVSERGSAQ